MDDLREIANQFDALEAKLVRLKELHAGDAEAESRLEAAIKSAAKASRLIKRHAKIFSLSQSS